MTLNGFCSWKLEIGQETVRELAKFTENGFGQEESLGGEKCHQVILEYIKSVNPVTFLVENSPPRDSSG